MFTRMCSSWELGHGDWTAIPQRGLMMTTGREPKRRKDRYGEKVGPKREKIQVGECLWRKAGQPWKHGIIAESHGADGAIT